MVELMLLTPAPILDILVIFDVVEFETPPYLGLDVLDVNIILVDNVASHFWNPIISNKDTLRFTGIWKI